MILLERLLDGLDIEVEPFALCQVRGRARLDLGRPEAATLHYVFDGEGALEVAGLASIPVAKDSVVVLPAGTAQVLASRGAESGFAQTPGRCEVPAGGLPRLSIEGEPVADSGVLMACGWLRATYRSAHGLFDYLPEPIVENFADESSMRTAFATLLGELSTPKPGTDALARALMQQCLVLLLRRYCAGGECRVAWLTALEDSRLGAAIAAMLDRPEAPHSVAGLAEIAGMSRSAFADRFSEAFARTPMDFLKEVRLRRAARLLRQGGQPVKALAAGAGYQSRSQFSRAFKAFFGMSPSEYRRALGEA